jgi:hypothetical protein
MSGQTDNILERRAHMLAGRLSKNTQMLRDALAPPGQRPPFTEQMTKADAVTWWRAHRFDKYGQDVVARMQPADVMELDQALSQANAADLMGGEPNAGGT